MKTVLILTMLGQCYPSRGYVQQRYYTQPTYNYAAPAYNNQIYYAPYVEKVKFVAVEQPGYDYYAALAAASLRSYERFQEYAQVPQTAALTYSIPSPQPVQVAQQPVYQAQAPVKQAPVAQAPVAQATPQQQTYAAPQQQQTYAAPQQQTYAAPQQQTYEAQAPAKSTPQQYQQLQTPSKNPVPGDDGSGGVPPPLIQQQRMDYSSAMGSGVGEVAPPPPVPAPPQAYQQQQQTYLQPTPVVSSVNSHFLSIVSKNCASCHTGASSKGGFSIFDYPGRLASLSQDDLQQIANQVAERKMPFKRVMSESDRRALLGMLGGNVSSLVSR